MLIENRTSVSQSHDCWSFCVLEKHPVSETKHDSAKHHIATKPLVNGDDLTNDGQAKSSFLELLSSFRLINLFSFITIHSFTATSLNQTKPSLSLSVHFHSTLVKKQRKKVYHHGLGHDGQYSFYKALLYSSICSTSLWLVLYLFSYLLVTT